jgi:predicted nuclease of restriction endonuclease-like (RecB) superfamily
MIANRLHERSQPALTTFDSSVPDADRESLRKLVKDPFILDFLAADPVKERDLSNALIANISKFLRELGVGWAFVGAEVPIQCGDSEYRLDLLFYHCKLHRYVVIELKLGHFEPQHVGQVNFYVQLVDDKLRDHTVDQATLGILLVVGRDDVTVEVALRGISTPLAVSEWRRLPPEVRRALPTAKDLTETVTRTVREIESAALPRGNCPAGCSDWQSLDDALGCAQQFPGVSRVAGRRVQAFSQFRVQGGAALGIPLRASGK